MSRQEPAPPQPRRYSSSGDFAYRIASLVALNAANVRATFVCKIIGSLNGICSVERKDRKSTRLNSSHQIISYAVFCLKKKTSRFPGAVRAYGHARIRV